jgi:hypothetical protein
LWGGKINVDYTRSLRAVYAALGLTVLGRGCLAE